MAQFLPAQIELLERQVDSVASHACVNGGAVHRGEVEELISIYVALLDETNKALARVSPRENWNLNAAREWFPVFERQIHIGRRIRDLARSLRKRGVDVAGIDSLMHALIAAHVGANAEQDSIALAAIAAGTLPTHPLSELADELSGRNQ